MPALHCECGVTLDVPQLEKGKVLRCPQCGRELLDIEEGGAIGSQTGGEASLALFQEQYQNLFPASELVLFSMRKAEEQSNQINQMMPRLLSIYEHDGECFPYVDGLEAARLKNPFSPARQMGGHPLGEEIFVRFCARTGRAALLGTSDRIKTISVSRLQGPFPLELVPMIGRFSVICAHENCSADNSNVPKKLLTPFRCPHCNSDKAILVFRLLTPQIPSVTPKADGVFRSIRVAKEWLVFEKPGTCQGRRTPAGKFPFNEIGLIYVHFFIPGSALGLVRTGIFTIRIYDRMARELFEYKEGNPPYTGFSGQDFKSFLLTLSNARPGVCVFPSWGGAPKYRPFSEIL